MSEQPRKAAAEAMHSGRYEFYWWHRLHDEEPLLKIGYTGRHPSTRMREFAGRHWDCRGLTWVAGLSVHLAIIMERSARTRLDRLGLERWSACRDVFELPPGPRGHHRPYCNLHLMVRRMLEGFNLERTIRRHP